MAAATDMSRKMFATYEGRRISFYVEPDEKVSEIKEVLRDAFQMGPVEGPSGVAGLERKVINLMHGGSNLDNDWRMNDVGIQGGSTIKVVLHDEAKPSLFVFCAFNGESVPIMEKINPRLVKLDVFRSIVSCRVGLPVSVFRLMSRRVDGREMFDSYVLFDYGVNLGDTVLLQTWDGWNNLLNYAIKGDMDLLSTKISKDTYISQFQLRVALYIAAHFGKLDLATTLIKQGIRSDDRVGFHPKREWCKDECRHIDTLKAPIHEAARKGQLGVLRVFVLHDICCVLARDGNRLTALSISLRERHSPCASFLFTKQWASMDFTKKYSVPLFIYRNMKNWSRMAKTRVFRQRGQFKSSLRSVPFQSEEAALIGNGLMIDGYGQNRMASKSESETRSYELKEVRSKTSPFEIDEPSPEVYFNALAALHSYKVPKFNKIGKRGLRTKSGMTDVSNGSVNQRNMMPSKADSRQQMQSVTDKGRGKSIRMSASSRQSVFTEVTEDGGLLKTKPTQGPPLVITESEHGIMDPESTSKAKSVRVEFPPIPKRKCHSAPNLVKKTQKDFKETIAAFEKRRGINSRDYALRCLEIGHSFKEKSYLQQVNHAVQLARRGASKTTNGQQYLVDNNTK